MSKAGNFKNKKGLVFGLGLLGGGVAATNWFLRHGADVTITDLKTKKQLASSLRLIKGRVKLKLGGHDEKDIRQNDVIVFNPDIPATSPYVRLARELGKQIENEATIFYRLCPKPIVAVTGTRGKTTTANWVGHFLSSVKKTIVAGNSYIEPLLKTLNGVNQYHTVVNEIPSYHLEFFDPDIPAPEIAVVTNLFQDHLNRHVTMGNYALAKSAIFKNQSAGQDLILNYDNEWTPFFLKQKTKSKIWFFSLSPLPKNACGVFYENDKIYFQENGAVAEVIDINNLITRWGEHNLQNLLASSLAAHLGGVFWAQIQKRIKTLPQIPFRQEVIYDQKGLKIINDTSATSPDGGIAAIDRFASNNFSRGSQGAKRPSEGGGAPSEVILITGGTDRQLDYSRWAKIVTQKLKPENVIFLAGSATDKMLKTLNNKFGNKVFETLEQCIKASISKAGEYSKSVVLFSPAAKSFEKFKNEFDRGRQFNELIKKLLK